MGRRDRGVPDRRRDHRRRSRSEHLGQLRAHAWTGLERRDRRHCLRPLPPLPGGRRPDGRARARRLPVLGVLAPRPSRGHGPREPGRARLLRPARRRAAPARHRPAHDPVPLGSPPEARSLGRLAGPLDHGGVRGVRGGRRRPPGRPRATHRHSERAVRHLGSRLPDRLARARAHRPGRGAGGGSPPARRPRPRCAGNQGRRSGGGRGDRPQLPSGAPCQPAHARPGGSGPGTRPGQPLVPRPGHRPGLPGGRRPRLGAGGARRCSTGICPSSRRRSTSSA